MALKLMGRKRGMTQRFDDGGNIQICTVIAVEPNIITQIKRKESDGYNALQLGFFSPHTVIAQWKRWVALWRKSLGVA